MTTWRRQVYRPSRWLGQEAVQPEAEVSSPGFLYDEPRDREIQNSEPER